jgi:hypothetical protein
VQGHLIVYNNITEIFTVDPKPNPPGLAQGATPARIKAMLTPRNTPTDEPAGNSLVPALRNSPRVNAPAGTRP